MNQSKVLSVQLTRGEKIAGWIYLPFFLLLLANISAVGALLLGFDLESINVLAQINLVYGLINFIAVAIIFHKFLIGNLDNAIRRLRRSVSAVILGLLLCYACTVAVNVLISWVAPELNNYNEESINLMAIINYRSMFLYTVLLAPIAEETLFRGLIFSSIQKHRRVLAYIVCMLAFASIHMGSAIGQQSLPFLLLNLIQYFPAGFALCWTYERADSIWAPIIVHFVNNAIAMLAG